MPAPPKLQRSYTKEQWATLTADRLLEAVETIDTEGSGSEASSRPSESTRTSGAYPLATARSEAADSQTSLNAVLDLHTNRRMKTPLKKVSQPKPGGKEIQRASLIALLTAPDFIQSAFPRKDASFIIGR